MLRTCRSAGRSQHSSQYRETYRSSGAQPAKLKVERFVTFVGRSGSSSNVDQLVYIVATAIFVLASAILANARTIDVLIGMRIVQAAGLELFTPLQACAELN